MPAKGDVIVVGGGIIGCAVARELARRGAAVRLFESRTVGGGATHASAGVLAPYIEGHDEGTLLELGVRSLAIYDQFVASAVAESGLAIDYRRTGTIEIALDDTEAEPLRARAVRHPELAAWLEPSDVRRIEPALGASTAGGLLISTHGYIAAGALTEALAWSAMRHGAEVEAGHRVTAIWARDERVGVRTEDGTEWTADHLVVCAGSWIDQIEGDRRSREVRPIRGQLLRLAWRGTPPTRVIWGPHCYVVPWQDGTVLVGATVEDVGFDERTTAAGVRDLLDAACELLPEAWQATFLEARAGLRPATPDGLPIIGRSATLPHVVYAAGHYRNGVLLAPLTAELVARLVLDDFEDTALASLQP